MLTYTLVLVAITQGYPWLISYTYKSERFYHDIENKHTIIIIHTDFKNAFLTGLKYPVIVITDKMFQILSTDEVTAILTHEFGHFYKRHIWKSLLTQSVKIALIVLVFSFFLSPLWTWVGTALLFYISKDIFIGMESQELEADNYVAQMGLAKEMISALIKLSDSKLTQKRIRYLYAFEDSRSDSSTN